MDIATILSAHDHPEVINDTLDSIKTWMTNDILLLIDGASKQKLSKYKFDAFLLEGTHHNYYRNPYRNIVLSLWQISKKWPNADWYCYMEYDCLVASDAFKIELNYANKEGIWCLGGDPRNKNIKLPLLQTIIKEPLVCTHYLLGCCVFYNGEFVRQLNDFFERFLFFTNEFTKGFFPGFEEQFGYDLMEYLLPSIANYYGGKIGGLAEWNEIKNKWTSGNYKKFPIRFRPELTADENFTEASIFHPIKSYDHPIREHHRKIRDKINGRK